MVYLDLSGKLVYEKDKEGNQIPDFSNVGYHSGEKALPQVKVMGTLKSRKGDVTQAKKLGPNVFVDGIGLNVNEHVRSPQRYATGIL